MALMDALEAGEVVEERRIEIALANAPPAGEPIRFVLWERLGDVGPVLRRLADATRPQDTGGGDWRLELTNAAEIEVLEALCCAQLGAVCVDSVWATR
ncbi:MAG: hypothetical protein OXK76_03870 [Gammaproteobacteria bacterium]|nr:hypothetical protein [Gammaproteobacteria bacterium]